MARRSHSVSQDNRSFQHSSPSFPPAQGRRRAKGPQGTEHQASRRTPPPQQHSSTSRLDASVKSATASNPALTSDGPPVPAGQESDDGDAQGKLSHGVRVIRHASTSTLNLKMWITGYGSDSSFLAPKMMQLNNSTVLSFPFTCASELHPAAESDTSVDGGPDTCDEDEGDSDSEHAEGQQDNRAKNLGHLSARTQPLTLTLHEDSSSRFAPTVQPDSSTIGPVPHASTPDIAPVARINISTEEEYFTAEEDWDSDREGANVQKACEERLHPPSVHAKPHSESTPDADPTDSSAGGSSGLGHLVIEGNAPLCITAVDHQESESPASASFHTRAGVVNADGDGDDADDEDDDDDSITTENDQDQPCDEAQKPEEVNTPGSNNNRLTALDYMINHNDSDIKDKVPGQRRHDQPRSSTSAGSARTNARPGYPMNYQQTPPTLVTRPHNDGHRTREEKRPKKKPRSKRKRPDKGGTLALLFAPKEMKRAKRYSRWH